MNKWIFLSLLLLLVSSTSGIIFDVAPNAEECLYEELEEDAAIAVSYQVMSGGSLDIDVIIGGPDNAVIYQASRESEGKFSFTTEKEGVYRFCFSNRMSTVTHKSVSLSVIDQDYHIIPATSADVDPLVNAVLQLSDALHTIQSENNYMRLREKAHRSTTESTNSRVLWFSLMETFVLVCLRFVCLFFFF
eukprot:TRINITY_DN1432_c0_g1_i1.p1 TRINITY_DN1432_c0_g1~~TRINITY_DN1432_c0_g1_i1.p1  ORF type:complete len:190 (+),score=32.85 TRINITY_DN1432_c0_g1_i1:145-714(+)